jgi:hypothetical protein
MGDEFCASLYDPECDPNCLSNTPLFLISHIDITQVVHYFRNATVLSLSSFCL